MKERCVVRGEGDPVVARPIFWRAFLDFSHLALACVGLLVLASGCRPSVEAGSAENSTPPGPAPVPVRAERSPRPSTDEPRVASATPLAGMSYTNVRVRNVPWSIHVVSMDRSDPGLEVRSAHATGGALGLSALSRHLPFAARPQGVALAAVNGDFYQRDRAFAGDPRGLQIVDGEVISGPTGGVAFWVDTNGAPNTGRVTSRFEVRWPNGRRTEFALNSERRSDSGVMLYTPSVGPSTRTAGGKDFVLEVADAGEGWRLGMGRTYTAKVREIRNGGNAPLAAGTVVISVGNTAFRALADVAVGSVVTFETASEPSLVGVRQAIGGGPVLVRGGQKMRISGGGDGYETSSMFERHPRSAVGWNDRQLFLVEVDGRQRGLSVGMTLEELATWMAKWGCREAMNLDGGGSATLWYDGQIRNSPCDGHERAIANSLVIVRKPAGATAAVVPASGGGAGSAAPVAEDALNGR